jgi:hypothetical protein
LKPVKVEMPSISALQKLITGDPVSSGGALAPYRSGPALVDFFNQFGGQDDEYGQGFPSRWIYAESRLSDLNGKPNFGKVIEAAVDPRVYFGTDFSVDDAVDYLNHFWV